MRYINYLDDKIISEASYLLSASNSEGSVFDTKTNKFIPKLRYTFLLADTNRYELNRRKVSEQLALTEENGLTKVNFENKTAETLLFAICLNPEVKVYFKGELFKLGIKIVDKETGEVFVDYGNELEKAVDTYADYLIECNYFGTEPIRKDWQAFLIDTKILA